MEDVTYLAGHCPRCSRKLPEDAPEGLCASCLFSAGAETLTQGTIDDAPTVLSAWDDSAGAGGDGQRLAPGQLWGPYRIGRLLGRGGMGEVYEAEHTETGRRLALKVLRSLLQNADDRARFLREGQLAASVSHPHTVYIFGSEEISGTPVISMELLPGGTLKDRVVAQGPLPPAEAVSAVLDIIGGLDAAHSAGILHRDIKPSNCFTDSEGSVKVGDFGLSISTLARDVRHDLATGGFQGTPQFAPPEQLRGEPFDVRADIYAVGATLYYLLTGQPPFEARDLRDLFARVTSEPAKSPRLIRREIPPGLASVVMQCLSKTPAQRPASYAALADALRPYSSLNDVPARPGLRLVAGMVDSVIVGLPVSVWVASFYDPITQETTAATNTSAWTWLLAFAYYFLLEGRWGASLGKRLFGLRVTSADGAAASWMRIARRTAVYHLPHMLLALLVVTGLWNGGTTVATARSFATLALVAALFVTVRRHNGWAACHDLASGTRVVHRSSEARRVRVSADLAPALAGEASTTARLRYGPFTVVSDAGNTGNGRLLVGFDPVLRRPVWIHAVPPHTPATHAARRDVSRIGRLHWLTGRSNAGENWDAFEAPDGKPFLTPQGPPPEWPTLKLWLLDLAHELTAGVRDGSAPALDLDRLWLRSDGHLVLLDFPIPSAGSAAAPAGAPRATSAPGQSSDGTILTPVGLLSAIATRGLPVAANDLGAPPEMPLSARALLDRWSGPVPPSLDEAHAALVGVASAPDRVWRWRRAIPIALAAAPIALLVTSAILLVPSLSRFMTPQNGEMLRLLEALRQPNPPATSRLADPEYRGAVERYLVGQYGTVLNDPAFWKGAVMQSEALLPLRRVAAEVTARHPSVSDEELARASAVLAPDRARAEQRRQARPPASLGGIIVPTLAAISVLFVLVCGVISSVVVPGGIVTRLLGLAVVSRDGEEISRWRSLVRVLLAWLPAIVWLAWLAAAPKIQGWVPVPPAAPLASGLALGALALGAIWTITRINRGPHDRLAGTRIVPR